MSSQVTIKDIARALGISASTVSRALKDHPDISRDTKDAVNDLAKKLRYKPNAVALSLKNSKTNTIGVIIPELVHYFFSSVISGIEDVAYEAGYNVMICQSNEKYEREIINAQALLSNRVEGALISISKHTKDFAHLQMLAVGADVAGRDRFQGKGAHIWLDEGCQNSAQGTDADRQQRYPEADIVDRLGKTPDGQSRCQVGEDQQEQCPKQIGGHGLD